MNTHDILNAIDAEIERLQQVRNSLAGLCGPKRSRGLPKRKTLSPAARKKIADAQRKRWAAQKAATKKNVLSSKVEIVAVPKKN